MRLNDYAIMRIDELKRERRDLQGKVDALRRTMAAVSDQVAAAKRELRSVRIEKAAV